jgi:hypothetical protein
MVSAVPQSSILVVAIKMFDCYFLVRSAQKHSKKESQMIIESIIELYTTSCTLFDVGTDDSFYF